MRGNVEQINGREGETATFLFGLSVKLKLVWWRFRPTSSQPLDGYLLNSNKLMWEIENHFKVRIGGNTYIDTPNIITYKGESLFTLKRHDENGYLGIYFDIYDSAGKRIASVKRNEIYYGDKDAYHIDGSLNRYVFSERASGRVICDIKKRDDAHPAELDVSAQLYTPDGFLLDATPEQTNLGGFVMRDNTFINCGGAIAIG